VKIDVGAALLLSAVVVTSASAAGAKAVVVDAAGVVRALSANFASAVPLSANPENFNISLRFI